MLRVEQTVVVKHPPEVVFDYLTSPSKLTEWQTSKTAVEQLSAARSSTGRSAWRCVLQPLAKRLLRRQFAAYHENLRPNLEGRVDRNGLVRE